MLLYLFNEGMVSFGQMLRGLAQTKSWKLELAD